jgi:glycosyltransferase involved in cell wall biosynthesis
MRVLFLTQYDANGPSSRIRVYQLQPFLRDLGLASDIRPLLTGDVKTLIASLFSDRGVFHKAYAAFTIALHFLKRFQHVIIARHYEVVVVQKDVLPFGLRPLLQLFNRNIVYEFDDAIWEPTPGQKRKSLVMAAIFRYRSRLFHRLLRSSRAIIAENSYLAEYATTFNRKVATITAPIDTHRYRSLMPQDRNGDVILGWIGSPGTTYLLESLEPALSRIGRCFDRIVVHNVGGSPIQFAGIPVRNITWSEAGEIEHLRSFSVGLMPLDDTAFNRGRLGYKMIIYASMGIPTVAADIGLNRTVIKHNETGFLARHDDDWIDYISRLIADPGLRERLGSNARRVAISEYDVRAAAEKYRTVLYDVLTSHE